MVIGTDSAPGMAIRGRHLGRRGVLAVDPDGAVGLPRRHPVGTRQIVGDHPRRQPTGRDVGAGQTLVLGLEIEERQKGPKISSRAMVIPWGTSATNVGAVQWVDSNAPNQRILL